MVPHVTFERFAVNPEMVPPELVLQTGHSSWSQRRRYLTSHQVSAATSNTSRTLRNHLDALAVTNIVVH
jgi:hypothetical protein